ncbi:protein SUPPRESSOR OF GENE SILENCING 3 [Striga asiatica]|uniref:Protein SUPPRESSOR OF GENE SILENCING 3 n=1 Tax=Striga asiatica TaxID=4170 RepID=A0A5A7QH75_STRAF|nr:protein SUPPRESSOR OF GENE SILENCING 3 [Striga asiatica]
MSLYSREGHMGMHTVKFSADESGLKEALRLSDYFEREKRGLKEWARAQPSGPINAKDDENNPNLVKLDPKTGEKKRVFYGHLATVADLDKVTYEIKKKGESWWALVRFHPKTNWWKEDPSYETQAHIRSREPKPNWARNGGDGCDLTHVKRTITG